MINYDGRRFHPVVDGETRTARTALYRQHGDLLWGEFTGDGARRGCLTGVCAPDGSLEFAYSVVLSGGEVVSGHCVSTPEFLADGRIRLHESWERFGRHADRGVSFIEETTAQEVRARTSPSPVTSPRPIPSTSAPSGRCWSRS